MTPEPASEPREVAQAHRIASRVAPLNVLVAIMVIAALYFGRDVLVPFLLAALLGFLLDPLVSRLRQWGLPRSLAVALVMSCTVSVVGAMSYLAATQVIQLSKNLPTYQSTVQHKLRVLRRSITSGSVLGDASRLLDVVDGEWYAARKQMDHTTRRAKAPPLQVQVLPVQRTAVETIGDVAIPVLKPLGTAAIVMLLVVFMLIERAEMRDRLLRLVGGDLRDATDALGEAADRVSQYLTMQLLVNVGYGVPMAAGLYFIGVPGALLWGLLGALLRFVPYVGPVVATLVPLTMAFAVDPSWSMLLWTLALMLTLELIANNIAEPLLYRSSTGLSSVSIVVSAIFWTALWGPIGLILATPLTACLAVLGRHLPQLRWLDVLLGGGPAFDPATRLYQRLLAGDVEAAVDMAADEVQAGSLHAFYSDTAVPALRLAVNDHVGLTSAEHRHRVDTGIAALIHELRVEYPVPSSDYTSARAARVLCIGGRWELDTLAADMLAHVLAMTKVSVRTLSPSATATETIAGLNLDGVEVVCLSHFSASAETQIRYVARRLKRRRPGLAVVVAWWSAPAAQLLPGASTLLGVDAVATSLTAALEQVQVLLNPNSDAVMAAAVLPTNEPERVLALAASGALDPHMRESFDRAAHRVADVFNTAMAVVSLSQEAEQFWHGAAGLDPASATATRVTPRDTSPCGYVVALDEPLVIEDVDRDTRFAGNAMLRAANMQFYAGVPLRTPMGHVLGALCVMDRTARAFTASELRLLGVMADDVMRMLALEAAARSAQVEARSAEVDAPNAEAAPIVPT